MALPGDMIAKLVPDEEEQKKFMRDIKVDARCLTDRIESIQHAVNVAPIKLHNLASDVKNCCARVSNMERKLTSIEFYLKELCGNKTSKKDENEPPKKKTKMVSNDVFVNDYNIFFLL